MNRQNRTIVVMAIAVATAALASFGVYTAIQRMPVKTVEVGTVKVVVAAENLPVGTPLRREQLKVVDWPAKAQVAGSFADPNDVIDRGVIETIAENYPVTTRNIASKEAGAGLSPIIPQGMRAMSVRVNDVINVAGYVVAGTRVDLLVTVKDENPTSGPKEAMARIVLSNLIVLTAGTRYDTEKGKDGKPQPSTVITLAVLPEDAEKVALAQSEGKLSLALRNPLDVDQTKTTGIKLAELMRAGAAPSPVINPVTRKAAPRPRPVAAPMPIATPPAPVVYRVEKFSGATRTEQIVN